MRRVSQYRIIYYSITILSLLVLICISGVLRADCAEMPLDFNVTVIAERPDMAEAMRVEIQNMFISSLQESGGAISPEMIKIEIWIYEIKEDVKTALEDYSWPPMTQKLPLEQKTVDQIINDYLSDSDIKFNEPFSEDWSEKARVAAETYKGIPISSKSFSYYTIDMKIFTVSVMSPCFDMKTFKLNKGNFLIVGEISIAM